MTIYYGSGGRESRCSRQGRGFLGRPGLGLDRGGIACWSMTAWRGCMIVDVCWGGILVSISSVMSICSWHLKSKYVSAPLPCRLAIVGLSDYKEKKKKKKNFGSTLCPFPLPHQVGAPYFDGKNVTDFLIKWGDLTLDWSEGKRIKRIPVHSDKLIGRYLKTRPSYTGADWDEFNDALLEEFKDDDEEQKRSTEAYLQCLVQDIRKEKNPTAGRYRVFIFEFAE